MIENDLYKVYLFYLKESHQLYAFTINKEYKNLFKEFRDMKKFIYKKIYLTELQLSIFQNKYHNRMLSEIYISDSEDVKDYLTVIGTPEEDTLLQFKISEIEDSLTNSKLSLNKFNLKTKYKDSIEYLTNICSSIDKTYSCANTLSIFYNLFKNTLKED